MWIEDIPRPKKPISDAELWGVPEMKTREESVRIARSWLRTPYVLGGRVKGAGCDCATLLAEYLIEIGAATYEELEQLGFYSHDWFHHATSERYLLHLVRYAARVAEGVCRGTVNAAPGSLVLFRVAGSRVFNHGGIITAWPLMVHATSDGVREQSATDHWLTSHREMAIFDPWGIDK
jgi:cell wall-associated NlpC family hydrolase